MPPSPLFELLQPRTGPVPALHRLPLPADEPLMDVVIGQQNFLISSRDPAATECSAAVTGCGSGLTAEGAAIPALAELVERHATTCWRPEELRLATAKELGSQALDLSSIPHCNQAEYSDPTCTVSPPDQQGVPSENGR